MPLNFSSHDPRIKPFFPEKFPVYFEKCLFYPKIEPFSFLNVPFYCEVAHFVVEVPHLIVKVPPFHRESADSAVSKQISRSFKNFQGTLL